MLSVSKASRQRERDFDPAGSRPIGTTRTQLEDGGSRTSASWEWPRAWLVEQTAQSYLAWGAAVRGGDLADHGISRRRMRGVVLLGRAGARSGAVDFGDVPVVVEGHLAAGGEQFVDLGAGALNACLHAGD